MGPHLRRKLRSARFAYWSIAVAETLCLGALLISLLNPGAAPLALLWLGWKIWRSPGPRALAAAIEARYPRLRETLTAAVELAGSADGSAGLRQQLFAEVDREIQHMEAGRLFSLKPVGVLIVAAIVLNVAVSVLRQREAAQRSRAAAPARALPEAARPRMTIAELAAELRAQPQSVLRKLPVHARSLDAAIETARAAEEAPPEEAAALLESAAETLAEFARAARELPELVALAGEAEELARRLVASALPGRAPSVWVAPGSDAEAVGAVTAGAAPGPVRVAPLPAEADAWSAPAVKEPAARWQKPPSQYEQQIREYFEQMAAGRL